MDVTVLAGVGMRGCVDGESDSTLIDDTRVSGVLVPSLFPSIHRTDILHPGITASSSRVCPHHWQIPLIPRTHCDFPTGE